MANFQQQKASITINQTMNHSVQQSGSSEGSDEGAVERKSDFLHDKFEEILEKHPDLTADQAFYLEYCKLYIDTLKIQSQVEQAIRQIEKLKGIADKQPNRIRKNISQHYHNDTSNSERRKRVRRTANQIARHYICRVQKCQKSYGSQGSLNQHMKLKHRELLDQDGLLLADK